jgi:uncharacterized protein with PIN domain
MKFAADRTVGKLAKWLRFLGYDTVFLSKITDDAFLALANEGRILLSRNTGFVGKIGADRFLLIQDNDPKVQLRKVLEALDVTPHPDGFFTRCILCNGVLETVDRQAVRGRVPDYVCAANKRFSKCAVCSKLYWPGSHLARCRHEIRRIFQDKGCA